MEKILLKEEMTLENIQRKELTEEVNSSNTKVVFGEVKVWKLDERNLNGRTYTTELGQRLVEENKITLALDNHPHSEFDIGFKDVRAVSKNPKIKEGYLVVDVHFVDEMYANRLEAILELGGKVGVSSFGYGTFDENKIVDVNSYELVRYVDFVINPSNQVYIDKEEAEEQVEEVEETLPETATADEGEATAKVDQITDEELEALRLRFEGKKNG